MHRTILMLHVAMAHAAMLHRVVRLIEMALRQRQAAVVVAPLIRETLRYQLHVATHQAVRCLVVTIVAIVAMPHVVVICRAEAQ